ncbi:MAG: DUF86 domain-containing protein [Micrococcales bacterium]|nr:DUF86 domain-containing protein [Micrococcales bacterium]
MRPKAGAHLWDAAEAAKNIRTVAEGKARNDLDNDLIIRSAIERLIELLGEALNRLRRDDPETAARVPGFDKVIGMRNILAHEYGDIDYEIVWSAVTNRVPELIVVLDELVAEAMPSIGE